MFALVLVVAMFLSPVAIETTVLHKFVDVKGNDAIREVRVLYDLYETTGNNEDNNNNNNNNNGTEKSTRSYESYSTPYIYRHGSINLNLLPSTGKMSTARPAPTQQQQQQQQQPPPPHRLQLHALGEGSALPPRASMHVQTYVHDSAQNYLEQTLSHHHHQHQHHSANELTAADRHKLATIAAVRSFRLIKGQPLFVELDFVPKFIPAATFYVAVSVWLPAKITGSRRPWILGWHQEVFPVPSCRLCTNHQQSYTLPVTLFLPDDASTCLVEGRVPTIWKVEAIGRENSVAHFADQTDMILAYGYDDLRQLNIVNNANSTHCRGGGGGGGRGSREDIK